MMPEILATRWSGEDAVALELGLPADHPAFAGHFPGQPILPGVVQLDWAVRLAAARFGHAYRPATKFQVKYFRLITPRPSGLFLTLRRDRARQELVFAYSAGDTPSSSGKFSLGA